MLPHFRCNSPFLPSPTAFKKYKRYLKKSQDVFLERHQGPVFCQTSVRLHAFVTLYEKHILPLSIIFHYFLPYPISVSGNQTTASYETRESIPFLLKNFQEQNIISYNFNKNTKIAA